ncbi:MAG: T9SS type A sorting domain-containing protein, partial [Bacteroidia bacterium]
INNNTDTGNDFGLIKSLVSMAPNQSYPNFTTNITISARGIFEVLGFPQGNITDIFVKYTSYEYHVPYNSINVVDSNTATATLTIPAIAPFSSSYSLYVKTDGVNIHWITNSFSVIDYPYDVSGNVYFDANSNGIKDAGDYGLPYQRIYITPHNNYYFTDFAGDYLIGTPAGATVVTWSPIAGSNLILTSDSASYTLNVSSNVSNLDFGINTTNSNYTSDIVFTSAITRCFTDVVYTINYSNQSNLPTNGQVKVKKDPLMVFVSSTPSPSSTLGDTLFWDYTNLVPLLQNTITATFHMPGPNTTLHSAAYITAVDGGNNVQFIDSALLNQSVVCSMDPNDKSVIPEGVQFHHYTLMSDTLEYLIRFQNTGNDTAFNVTVIDYLDGDLDFSTFNLISSSHSVLSELKNNGELKFTFNNILLPDSNINEPESHGFIKYRIMAKAGLPNYTAVQNSAFITFDLNAPVVTNTTLNTLVYVIPVSVIEQVTKTGNAIVYPNPFNDFATIVFNNDKMELFNLNIRDINGSMVFTKQFKSDRVIIQKASLAAGIYFFELFNADYSIKQYGKFVIR